MKCDPPKLSLHKGSPAGRETGPLFSAVHVNDTGTVGLRAPPRHKMALFEQCTVPFNSYLPSSQLAAAECASSQQDTSGRFKTSTHHAIPVTLAPAIVSNKGVGRIGRSSPGSSLGSVSTCSAIVNVDESQRLQVAEPADDMSMLFPTQLEMVPGKVRNTNDKVSKGIPQDVNLAKGISLSSHVVTKGGTCEQVAGAKLGGSGKLNQDSTVGGNGNADNLSANVRPYQAAENNEGLPSGADSRLFGSKSGDSRPLENNEALNGVQGKALDHSKKSCRFNTGNSVKILEKSGVSRQGETFVSLREEARSLPAILKPKDVVHTVGQQLFWKARKAILRQQEVFSDQVFELHKLIKVQKLLAKMPSTLIEEHLLSRPALDRMDGDFYPVKINSKKLEIMSKGAQQAPAPNRCEGEGHGSKRKARSQAIEQREGQVVGSSHKRQASSSTVPQALTNAPFGQAPHSSSSNGVSAWGYPLAPLNRPFLYPPGAGRFSSGTGFGGTYVANTNPPMAPFTFPCHTQRPDQLTPGFCSTNQWSTPMYHHPLLSPMANDWYPTYVPLPSGSERLGPTNSVASINMRAEASSQSAQPAVAPLSRQQQVEKSNHTKRIAAKSFGSIATASVFTAPDALSGKPGVGHLGEHNPVSNSVAGPRLMPTEVWAAFGGDKTGAAVEVRGQSKFSKERAQMSQCSREDGTTEFDRLLEKNALNLFPLQPSSSWDGQGEGNRGGVIKSIPRSALAASESAAEILLSIQREKQL